MNAAGEFLGEVTEYQRLQEFYSLSYGAADTEPDRVFQIVTYNAIHGTNFPYWGEAPWAGAKAEFPITASDWELFTKGDDVGAQAAAKELSNALRVVVAAAQRAPEAARRWAEKGCWRVVSDPQEAENTVKHFMNAAENQAAWMRKFGGDYATDAERRAAYRDFKANLATLAEVFGQEMFGHGDQA
jgi:hypothetical protein